MNAVLFVAIVVLLISCAFVMTERFVNNNRYPLPLPLPEYNLVTKLYPYKAKSFTT